MKKESQPAAGVCTSFLGGTKREHRGLAVVALFTHSGTLSAASASASVATATTATATASTHLERNELRARPDHSRHKIPIHKKGNKKERKEP